MQILIGVIVFIIGLFVVTLGAGSNSTMEYAVLYLAAIITMCTTSILQVVKNNKQEENKHSKNEKISSWKEFSRKVSDIKKGSSTPPPENKKF